MGYEWLWQFGIYWMLLFVAVVVLLLLLLHNRYHVLPFMYFACPSPAYVDYTHMEEECVVVFDVVVVNIIRRIWTYKNINKVDSQITTI